MTSRPVITKYRRVLPYELIPGMGYEPLYAVAPATLSPVCTASTKTYFPHLLEILQRDPSALKWRKRNCRMYYKEMTTDGLNECELPNNETGVAYMAYILPHRRHIFGISYVARLGHHSFEEHVYGKKESHTDKMYHKDDLALGTIISAPYHSQKREDTVSTYDHNTGVTALFTPSIAKWSSSSVRQSMSSAERSVPMVSVTSIKQAPHEAKANMPTLLTLPLPRTRMVPTMKLFLPVLI
ncbi:hypothetical protein FSST1_006339 [Fusarium sambucinum]